MADPGPTDGVGDCCFETCLRDLELQFRGGFSCDGNPVLFTDRCEAEMAARDRLAARDTAKALTEGAWTIEGAGKVQVLDADGNILFAAPVGKEPR